MIQTNLSQAKLSRAKIESSIVTLTNPNMTQALTNSMALTNSFTLPQTFRLKVHIEVDEEPELTEHLGIARKAAVPFVGANPEGSEEYSDALLGLWNAIKSFTDAKGSFSHYALVCCRNAILDGIKVRNRSDRSELRESFDDIPHEDECIPLNLIDQFLSPLPEDTESDRVDKWILSKHYIDGESWEDIGYELGFPEKSRRNRAYQMGKRGIAKIQAQYHNLIETVDW